jgi:Kef-type K+ transport system membrane component KefB
MIELTLLLVVAAVAFTLSRWLKTPVIPLLLAGGFALGLVNLAPERAVNEQIVFAGVLFLVFVAGMEMNPDRFTKQRNEVFWIGALQFLVLGAAGVALAYVLGFGIGPAIYLGMAMAASSTLVVMRLLRFRQQLFEPFGRLVVGVLLLQDIAVIVLMVVAAHLGEGLSELGTALGAMLTLLVATLVCARWVGPQLVERYDSDEELLLISSLALLFVFIGLTIVFEIPAVAGAFFAGVALSPFPIRGVIRGLFKSVSDFFLAIFFTTLGALAVITSLTTLLHALAFCALVIVLTPILVATIAERSGFTSRNAFESGLLLSQTSEFSLIVGLQGLMLSVITEEVFSIIVLVTVITMVITPMITSNGVITRLMMLHPRPPGPHPSPFHPVELDDHIVLIGRGTAGSMILERAVEAGEQIVVIDHDPAVVAELHEREIPAVWGDATDPRALTAAGAEHARMIVSTAPRLSDLPELIRYAQRIPVYIHVFDPEVAERIEQQGATPVLYTEAAADDFMDWFDERFGSASPS